MQNITLQAQTLMFLLSCGFGFFLGIVYDLFRLIRMTFLDNKLFVIIEDIIYFTICGILTFLFALVLNSGEIRFYLILGEIFGWIIYYNSLGKIIFSTTKFIVGVIKTILEFCFTSISAPFYLIIKIIRFFIKLSKKIMKKTQTILE